MNLHIEKLLSIFIVIVDVSISEEETENLIAKNNTSIFVGNVNIILIFIEEALKFSLHLIGSFSSKPKQKRTN